MIIFDLECLNSHRFEGWFKNAAEFENQLSQRLVVCPVCGSDQIAKLPTASRINLNRHGQKSISAEVPVNVSAPDGAEQQVSLKSIEQLRDYVNKHFDNVGDAFSEEARRIHYGEVQERNIYGTATADELKTLHEEGIGVLPLPADRKKLN